MFSIFITFGGIFFVLGADSCIKTGNSIQCKISFVEDRVTQAFTPWELSVALFTRRLWGSFGWAERYVFCKVCMPGKSGFTQALQDFCKLSSRRVGWGHGGFRCGHRMLMPQSQAGWMPSPISGQRSLSCLPLDYRASTATMCNRSNPGRADPRASAVTMCDRSNPGRADPRLQPCFYH